AMPGQGPGAIIDHARSAAQYETQAATQSPPIQVDSLLAAAREWLAAGRAADATRVLSRLNAVAVTPAQSAERGLLNAESSLDAQRPQEAWQRIAALPEPTAAAGSQRFFLLKIRIALAAGRPVDAVLAEMAGEHLASASERTGLRSQLLAALRDARDHDGLKLEPQASQDPIVRGWLELGSIATQARGASLTADADAARWRARYPNHPADEVLSQAFPSQLPTTALGARVALLLPLTGAAAAQASTVRDGFLSAYYQLPAANRPDLRLYDTGALPGPEALSEARAAGSSFVVGPLTREDVASVANTGPQAVPVLALNFLPPDRPAPNGFYQFALSPEEEAQMVAHRMIADGHHRGIALIPRGDWGTRVADAFTRELVAGGGTLIATATYNPSDHDYGSELQSVLHVDDSVARHQRLQSVLGGKLNFEPRRRADIEFVFVAAPSATTARLIEPQLKFFYAGDVPSYTLSNAYEPDSTASNQDIDGLMFPDMPWMVSGDGSIDQIRNSISQAWESRAAWRSRLFAFGYDACQLMVAMSAKGRSPADAQVAGLTGTLHFDADRRVRRDLIWVQVRNGEPRRLSDPAPN
ncbi:MAG TPA: penicillin-binding protein activator, partial [Steroidobacteraceae bacterium]|nr:penicillin-binding protein activator [Steroidobacteraceae bacterium]